MSVAAAALPAATEPRASLRRWTAAAAIVVLAHGAIAAWAISRRDWEQERSEPPAMMIDLAPLAVSSTRDSPAEIPVPQRRQTEPEEKQDTPPEAATSQPATPQPATPEPAPPEPASPEPPTVPPPLPESPLAAFVATPAVVPAPRLPPQAMPPSPPKRHVSKAMTKAVPKHEPVEPAPPRAQPKVTQLAAQPPAQAMAAPRMAAQPAAAPALSSGSGLSASAWKSEVMGRLNRSKRYPETARARHAQGTASLSFSIDRSGNVVAAHLAGGTGFPDLDEEALAMVHRASPLPPPPAELAGARITLTVPVRFNVQ
ncbi:outer membrane transport energization protein TonB [Rhizobiales bacterium GAS191]|nr:outer membrane transport energization protein TonB [Rhizobiales bacterium GAS191]